MKDFTANTERVLLRLDRPGDVTVGRDRHRKICPAHKVSVRARNYRWLRLDRLRRAAILIATC
jgi:hypothetical protein